MKNYAFQREQDDDREQGGALDVIVLGALLISNLAGIPLLSRALPMLLLNAIFAAILISVMRWWGRRVSRPQI